MRVTAGERRRKLRSIRTGTQDVMVTFRDGSGAARTITAKLLDVNEGGCAMRSDWDLPEKTVLHLKGDLAGRGWGFDLEIAAAVTWKRREMNGYRIGVEFLEDFAARNKASDKRPRTEQADTSAPSSGDSTAEPDPDFVDYYEMLQLSPNATADTVHRVYRLLAQRFHPDNAETGDAEQFRKLSEAHHVLSDTARRASYDNRYNAAKRLRWRIFGTPSSSRGVEGERRQRRGVLALLCQKRMLTPRAPWMTVAELEEMLGIPKEHLEYTVWYLRERGLVDRGDSGRLTITVAGIDVAEDWMLNEGLSSLRLESAVSGRS